MGPFFIYLFKCFKTIYGQLCNVAIVIKDLNPETPKAPFFWHLEDFEEA
jgi:hypothetical protein